MTSPPPQPGPPGDVGWGTPQPGRAWQQQQPQQQPQQPQQRFAPPQQFQPVPDAMLASQRSSRVATRALIWAIVACVVSAIPLLGLVTIAAAIPALQIAIAARVQRLGGGGRAVWAIVLAILAILGSVAWTIGWFVTFVALVTAGTSSV